MAEEDETSKDEAEEEGFKVPKPKSRFELEMGRINNHRQTT